MEFWEDRIKQVTGNMDTSYYPSPELILYPVPETDRTTSKAYQLAYKVDIRSFAPWVEKSLYINAASGAIIRELELVQSCFNGTVETNYYGDQTVHTELVSGSYRLFNDCLASNANIHVRDWNTTNTINDGVPPPNPQEITSSDNTWNNTTNQEFGASTMFALEKADAYFKNVHGRNSYNNSNGNLDVFINAIYVGSSGNPYTSNAAYHGNGLMTVGIGNPAYAFPDPACISDDPLEDAVNTIDILGHEYGHGVNKAEANLNYVGESGALDESFADIYGSMVEFNALGTNDWLIGDERCTGALRNLADPNDYDQPDTYQGTYWAPAGANDPDFGGVHTNSGVQNFWFYLLCTGGSGVNDHGWSYDVSSIGVNAAQRITYRNHTTYLTSTSKYADARNGAIQAAGDLYGECSFTQLQVAHAWRAVGVGYNLWGANLTLHDLPGAPVKGDYAGTTNIDSPGTGFTTDINSTDGTSTFRAGNKITLKPGFRAIAGTDMFFSAKAGECSQ